jgi:hypothetical protein
MSYTQIKKNLEASAIIYLFIYLSFIQALFYGYIYMVCGFRSILYFKFSSQPYPYFR